MIVTSSLHALLVPVAILFVLNLFLGVAPDCSCYGSEHNLLLLHRLIDIHLCSQEPKTLTARYKVPNFSSSSSYLFIYLFVFNAANDLFSLIMFNIKVSSFLSIKGALIILIIIKGY